jgi:four helix bundle protein
LQDAKLRSGFKLRAESARKGYALREFGAGELVVRRHSAFMGHFKNLRAWEHARALAIISKPLIDRLPSTERSGLADQWRRAASSVVLNIAEGASRRGSKDFRRSLDIARASLDEIEAIIDLAVGLDYLRRDDVAKVSAIRDECARTVFGLIRKLGVPVN